ncbi:helix-turn-helix domain-containing protein [Sporomusa aerivorans]|uniref:helix-turn-helix domain-containing protein n=1 Tax=Sporomusa aerivorans TaxID=204936 RepID=UPI00352AA41D
MGNNQNSLVEFAKYFTKLYEGRRLTKAELSRLSGVSEATLSRIESADQKPSPATLKKLAPHLMVTEKELLIKAGYLDSDSDQQLDQSFFRVMQDAKNKGYDADDIRLALDFLERARKRDN